MPRVDHSGGSALAAAEAAHALVEADPARARRAAEQVLVRATAQGDVEARAAALHAIGFAQHALGDPAMAATLRRAVRAAERGGHLRRAALARRTLAGALAESGRVRAALREVNAAQRQLTGLDRARSEVFYVGILALSGDPERPGERQRTVAALRTLRAAGDSIWQARLLYNRGWLAAQRGDVARAAADLARSRDLNARIGAPIAAAEAEIAIAELRLAEGEIPAALAALDAIDQRRLPAYSRAELALSRARALLAARVLDEAQLMFGRAAAIWAAAASSDRALKASLESAAAALLDGEHEVARAAAGRAVRAFAARRQPVQVARARGLALAADVAGRTVDRRLLRRSRLDAQVLADAGWTRESQRLRVLIAIAAIQLGDTRLAAAELARVHGLRARGVAGDRIQVLYADALLDVARGDRAQASRRLARGIALLDAFRATLGAGELRVSVSTLGVDLAQLGVELALGGGRPRRTLEWVERLRAGALRSPPVRPAADPVLARLQLEQRRTVVALRQAEQQGSPVRALITRQVVLEHKARARARHAPGDGRAAGLPAVVPELLAVLGDRVLVEYAEAGGSLLALCAHDGLVSQIALGPAAHAAEQLKWLRFALRRVARRDLDAARRESALTAVSTAARDFDALLIEPLGAVTAGRELVIVPTATLNALPWATLPSLRGRDVSVAPSAAIWAGLAPVAPGAGRRTALIAGPRLAHATREIRAVARLYPGARVLSGPRATVAATLAALDGAALAHVACHGRFRSDSPLFSSLELADGDLTALSLERLRRAPRTLVLSACDLALSDARPGDELLGVSAALLALGTRTIIASSVAVPDRDVVRLMTELHRRLGAGTAPASALAGAQARLGRDHPELTTFVCIGAG